MLGYYYHLLTIHNYNYTTRRTYKSSVVYTENKYGKSFQSIKSIKVIVKLYSYFHLLASRAVRHSRYLQEKTKLTSYDIRKIEHLSVSVVASRKQGLINQP